MFVELPKFPFNGVPANAAQEWAFVFRRASTLKEMPAELHSQEPKAALDVAKIASFTEQEWDDYDREQLAEQDARALTLAQRMGRAEGITEAIALGNVQTLTRWCTRALTAESVQALLDNGSA